MKLLRRVKSRRKSTDALTSPSNASSTSHANDNDDGAHDVGGGAAGEGGVFRLDSGLKDVPLSPPAVAQSPQTNNNGIRPLTLGTFSFDSTSTSYTYPTLHTEASTMLSLSLLIYTLSELRDLARNGILNDPIQSTRVLQMPLPLETALDVIKGEREMLLEVLSDGRHGSTLSALEGLRMDSENKKARTAANATGGGKKSDANNNEEAVQTAQDEQTMSDIFTGWMDSWNGCLAGGFSFDEVFCGGDLGKVDGGMIGCGSGGNGGNNNTKIKEEGSILYTMGDKNANEELVYAVGINHVEERITVVFRGSVTKADFMTDAKISMIHVSEPSTTASFNNISNSIAQSTTIGIHQGFYDYLFSSKSGKPSKYEEIMSHVQHLFNESSNRRKQYKLYVTGHSLGGALATLFGYFAASSASDVPLPVTIVSVASPRVGNLNFARSFTEMESQGKIRHLRIANHKDPVTLGPTVSSKKMLSLGMKTFSPLGYLALKATGNEGGDEEVYYHTGIKMKLRSDVTAVGSSRCELSYSGASILVGSRPTQAEDKEDLSSLAESSRKKSSMPSPKSSMSSADIPMVSYHYGESYSERMALVEKDLVGMTLNRVYKEEAR
eukprot:scaffold13320_cov215-Alexandrium_tamarense.AAC.20